MSNRKWRDLIMHFSKYPLRNSDFEFPDLLGAAYEYLVRDFADSAGKKGGEFYTPRPVVQLMVRLLDPQEGMSVYDPCSGSGGMLVYARNHVADNGGNADNLRLAGQESSGTTWSISKMNMLLHGIRDADLRNEDTLASQLRSEFRHRYPITGSEPDAPRHHRQALGHRRSIPAARPQRPLSGLGPYRQPEPGAAPARDEPASALVRVGCGHSHISTSGGREQISGRLRRPGSGAFPRDATHTAAGTTTCLV